MAPFPLMSLSRYNDEDKLKISSTIDRLPTYVSVCLRLDYVIMPLLTTYFLDDESREVETVEKTFLSYSIPTLGSSLSLYKNSIARES